MPESRPQTPWRGLLALARPHRKAIGVAFALGLVGATCGLLLPLAAREVIEALAEDRSLGRYVVLLLLLIGVEALVEGVHLWLLDRTAERIVLGARLGLVSRLLRLEVSALDRATPGDLVSRVTSDSTLLRAAAANGVAEGATAAVTLAATLVLMGVVDLVLLATTLGLLAVIGISIAVMVPRIGQATRRGQERVGEIGGALERVLGAIRTVKASRAEEREEERIAGAARAAYGEGVRAARFTAASGVLSGIGLQLTFLAVLGVGGARVADGAMTVGDLVAFLLYIFYLAAPVTLLVAGATQLQAARAAMSRIQEVEAMPVEADAPRAEGLAIRPGAPALAFRAVTFTYPGAARSTLRDVSFSVPAVGQTAIVGPSGAGKTTIFSLVERFHRPDSGRVSVLGQDVATVPRDWVRRQVGYVEQEAPVLAGTLRENLTYAAPGATDAEIEDAVRDAQLDGLLARLPDGLATEIGTRGVNLSGGERQRVAIARALVGRPALILLDEATAQLDAVTEQELRDTVARIARSRAVLVIAHRLSTVVDADEILVLEDGSIRARGTHGELVEEDALYRTLAETQLLA